MNGKTGDTPPVADTVEDRLRAKGLLVTRARVVILDALRELDRPVDAETLFEVALTRRGSMGRATIYRALLAFAKVGLVSRHWVREGYRMRALYRLNRLDRPDREPGAVLLHTLVCRCCQRTRTFADAGHWARLPVFAAGCPESAAPQALVIHYECGECAAAARHAQQDAQPVAGAPSQSRIGTVIARKTTM